MNWYRGSEPNVFSIARQDCANDNSLSRLRLDDTKLTVALGEQERTTGERHE